jgi:AraC-like DNA-binding protein
MQVEALVGLVSKFFTEQSREESSVTPLPGLRLISNRRPTLLQTAIYDPVLCLILQGRKSTTFAEKTVDFGPGESLLVSHDLPVVWRITEAPYLALLLSIDFEVLRTLSEVLDEAPPDAEEASSFDIHKNDPQLLDAFARYLALASSPLETRVLAPLLLKELHFRLLMAPYGAMLRRLVQHDSHPSSIARAIKHIRTRFTSRLLIPKLAQEVGMSASAFHRHFKAITATTPLQYQKELRLLEARRLLLTVRGYSVSEAAFRVGYESPTQFSREYSRKFGTPPSADG